ncbi:MAG TPA: GDP-mannose mannosyl hydrolase [Terriglobia bacterium]|jgi:colanic acid biosynthesis protein WcaH
MLEPAEFKSVVRNTPLLAVDLIVKSPENKILLGLRKNAPARGFWFVPGGRIFKNESAEQAFRRISREELGLELDLCEMKFRGIYDHIYEGNVFEDPGFNTHYVVMASEVVLPHSKLALSDAQHNSYRFVDAMDLRSDPEVHPFTKSYFADEPSNLWKFQYGKG